MKHTRRFISLSWATCLMLLLAGCVTPGGYGNAGGYGNTNGYGLPAPGYPAPYGNQIQASVDSVDTGYQRLLVLVHDPRTGRTERVGVRYDQRTRLVYQGREQQLEGLERGDIIRIEVVESGRELWARSIELVRNVRDDGYGDAYGYGNDVRGSVAYVDTRARVIRLDGAGYGNDVQLAYDDRTTVEYQGRSYRPENLERGDSVRIQARQVSSNQWLAIRIIVERSVRQ